MSQLSIIKHLLSNCNETLFQQLCDSYLVRSHKYYKSYTRSGAHPVKDKTTTGTPDSFFLLNNDKYLLIETTTLEHKGRQLITKLKKDISACLNESKTGINLERIDEIIICYNSNLNLKETEEINRVSKSSLGYSPTHYNLDRLSNDIFLHHKDLAHQFLKMPLDTCQIISLERFINEYDTVKQKLSTPLRSTFYHRTIELELIDQHIRKSDLLILSGPAGVGKTKLAIEAIDRFTRNNLDYHSHAISFKGADILRDLHSYFKDDNKSVLLIDDVNRVDYFAQIISFYKTLQLGTLKLILTVRDYALQQITEKLYEYKASIITVPKLTYDEIKLIISKEPYTIRNYGAQERINEIAQGNARLSIMLALVAKKSNTLDSLNNVGDVFEDYYSSILIENDVLKDKKSLQCLAILAFFYTIPYNDDKIIASISKAFNISDSELISQFELLHSNEFIELTYGHARTGEQNLSTYFFYLVFIKNNLLSLEDLYFNFYQTHNHRFKDTIHPAFRNFGRTSVAKKIRPAILKYWYNIKHDPKLSFPFLQTHWEYIPNETLSYLESSIALSSNSRENKITTDHELNQFASIYNQENHLQLLSTLLDTPSMVHDALSLMFKFTSKNLEHTPQLSYHLQFKIRINENDRQNIFSRQSQIQTFLCNLNEELPNKVFLAISKPLLESISWQQNASQNQISDTRPIVVLKKIRLHSLQKLFNIFSTFPEEVLSVLIYTLRMYHKNNTSTVVFDLGYIITWIKANLDIQNFRHCYYVQELCKKISSLSIKNVDTTTLIKTFTNTTYSILQTLKRPEYDSQIAYNQQSYDKHKETQYLNINDNFTFRNISEIDLFTQKYRELLIWREINYPFLYDANAIILRANLNSNIELGFSVLVKLIQLYEDDRISRSLYLSAELTDQIFSNANLFERFWKKLEDDELNSRWRLVALTRIGPDLIEYEHVKKLLHSLTLISGIYYIDLESILKYKTIESKIITKILMTITEINKSSNTTFLVSESFIQNYTFEFADLNALKLIYIQMKEHDSHYDHDGLSLLAISKRDTEFIKEYSTALLSNKSYSRINNHNELQIIWSLASHETLLNDILELIKSLDDPYILSKNFFNSYFPRTSSDDTRPAEYIIDQISKHYRSPRTINIIFDVILNSRNDLFDKAFELYITLNQNVNDFRQITWENQFVVHNAETIISNRRAARWEHLLKIVESTNHYSKTLQIRLYIKNHIAHLLDQAEAERRDLFFRRW